MKLVVILTLTCLACVLNTQGFEVGNQDDEKTLVKRFIPFGFASTFLEAGCKYGPFECTDHIRNRFNITNGKGKENADKDKDKKANPEAGGAAAGADEAADGEAPAE